MRRAPVTTPRGPALVLFAVMVAHALLETARDALFLARLGPGRLAWAYIAIAGLSIVVVSVARRRSGGRDPRRLLLGALAVAALGTGAFAALVAVAPAAVFALYLWTGVVAAVLLPAFWLVVDRAEDVTGARRTFAGVAAAGGLGALAGFVIAAVLGGWLGARALVIASAIAFALAGAAATRAMPAVEHRPSRVRAARRDQRAALARSARYVALLLVLGLLATLALTLGDLVFKRMVAARFPAADLPLAFGVAYAGLNVLGLLVQLAVTTRALDRIGVGGALAVLPALVLVSGLGLAVTAALGAVVALKLADGALRHGLHRVASEILFLPLVAQVRESGKHLVEVIGQRGGQALAALLTLVAAGAGAPIGWMGALIAVLAAAWLVTVGYTRRAYLRQLRDRLEAGEVQRTGSIPSVEADAAGVLEASLASPVETEAVAALDVLAAADRPIPALVLYHPSSVVVRHALRLLHGDLRDDVRRVLAHLTEHADPEIRAAALTASSRHGCHHVRLVGALAEAHPDVRAAAVIGLVSNPCGAAPVVEDRLAALVAGTVEEQVALVRAIGRTPDARFRPLLLELVARREPSVVREVLLVWQEQPELADVELLLELLGAPSSRTLARLALAAAGPRALPRLVEALEDPRTPLAVRRHLPRTISRFRAPAAAAALVARLLREPDGTTEFKILRALGRMRADEPSLTIAPAPLHAYVRRSIDDAVRYDAWGRAHRHHAAAAAAATATTVLLDELLAEKRAHAIERAFRALGVLHPAADLRSLHDALLGADAERRATARELLEHLVAADVHRPLLALLDASAPPTAGAPIDEDRLLASMLADPSDMLRVVAAHHIAELRVTALRSELVHHKPRAPGDPVTRAFDQAIARLDA